MAKIVVGIDGSDASKAALRWAVDEAKLRDAQVVAVHAWSEGRPHLSDGDALVDIDWEGKAQDLLDVAVDEIENESHPLIQKRLVHRSPADALVRASEDADLLVVGSRGYGAVRGLILGSVAQHCVRLSPAPVVVIPHHRRAA